mmetsp:Transcript_11177/g.18789  ORF Transcript_11177/g.18789 Transcript_11177/m.18789 type:complete len:146 (+) Transcript_11177:25-462(+)
MGCPITEIWTALLEMAYSFFSSKLFIANAIISISFLEFCLQRLNNLDIKSKEQKEIDLKYGAFKKMETRSFSRIPLYIMAPFAIFRFIGGWLTPLIGSVFFIIAGLTQDKSKPLSPRRQRLIGFLCYWVGRIILYFAGALYYEIK